MRQTIPMITVEQDPDENNNLDVSRWSVPELKERQSNISVFARISEEYNDSEHCWEYVFKTATILFQTKAASCLFALSLFLPIVMIGVGSFVSSRLRRQIVRLGISNLEECPLNRNIPVFVLVGGAIALLKLLQILWKQYSRRRGPAEEETSDSHNGSIFMEVLTSLFLIFWFIYGNHLVLQYRIPRFEQTTEDPENWCKKNVYLLTIISIVYTYALMTLMILTLFLVVFTVHCHQRTRDMLDETSDETND